MLSVPATSSDLFSQPAIPTARDAAEPPPTAVALRGCELVVAGAANVRRLEPSLVVSSDDVRSEAGTEWADTADVESRTAELDPPVSIVESFTSTLIAPLEPAFPVFPLTTVLSPTETIEPSLAITMWSPLAMTDDPPGPAAAGAVSRPGASRMMIGGANPTG